MSTSSNNWLKFLHTALALTLRTHHKNSTRNHIAVPLTGLFRRATIKSRRLPGLSIPQSSLSTSFKRSPSADIPAIALSVLRDRSLFDLRRKKDLLKIPIRFARCHLINRKGRRRSYVSLNLLMTSSKPFLSSHDFSSGSTSAAARSSAICLRTLKIKV